MRLDVDRDRLAEVLADAASWPGILAVRAWVNEGDLTVGDDIMKVLVAGDIREHVFAALQRLVGLIKDEVAGVGAALTRDVSSGRVRRPQSARPAPGEERDVHVCRVRPPGLRHGRRRVLPA